MIYQRGQYADYDAWASKGNKGWNWDSVRPYFQKSLDYSPDFFETTKDNLQLQEEYPQGGEWKVQKQRLRWGMYV
jgi:choline dehydrogenase-like flavoprotein